MISIIGYIFIILVSVVCGMLAFINLLETGAPIMGLVLFGCGALFVGGWAFIAVEMDFE